MINRYSLIKLFQTMYEEHWKYESGAARYGCVDCSGAFAYAFRQLGGSIAHGSNTIGRGYIVGELLPISKAKPGMAAFKLRDWTEEERDNRWCGTSPGDLYHIGLVDEDPKYILNAKGTKSGFCRDTLDGTYKWHFVAYLKGVDYTSQNGGEEGMNTATVVLPNGTTGSTVNIREQASTSSKLVERVKVGSKVTLLEDQGDWCKIRYGGKTGWMLSNFLEYDGQDTSGEIDSTETITGGITALEREEVMKALAEINSGLDILDKIFKK